MVVVVPAHNESRLIGRVVATTPSFVDYIIVVDDASTDDTAGAALAVGDPRAEVIRLESNQGVGGAILTGHERALELDADVSVVMAGDAQMDPGHLPDLLDPIADGHAQFTKANRFYAYGSFTGMPKHRVLGNILISFFTKAASGYWGLFDPLNGYTALHRSALERLAFDRIARRYDFENDLLIHLNILRITARDVPIPALYGEERSGIRLGRIGFTMLARLWRGFWHRVWRKYVVQSFSPVALLLFSGLSLLLVGLAVGIFIVANTLGPPVASAGTVLLCVGPLLSGLHLLIFSMFLDIQEGTS